MKITVLTLFPEMFHPILNESIMKRAIENNLIEIELINFRDFSTNKHKTVDDTPYGGGAGMVLSVEPIYYALQSIDGHDEALKILLTPQGKTYHQQTAKRFIQNEHIILICGHYEGFDERIRSLADEEISIGDYVLTCGEIPAMVIIDTVVRLIPGVLGEECSLDDESFNEDLLEYPHYTRPQLYRKMKVPDILLSGDHKKIEQWRKKESVKRTKLKRKDLLKKRNK